MENFIFCAVCELRARIYSSNDEMIIQVTSDLCFVLQYNGMRVTAGIIY